MAALSRIVWDGRTVCSEYISATTVAMKHARTMSISRSRIIQRGVDLTLKALKILKSSNLLINNSILSFFSI